MSAPDPYLITWDSCLADEDIGEFLSRLAALRRSLGVTQAQLSARTGLGRTQISMFENNRREPSLSVLLRYVSGLGGSVSAHAHFVDDSTEQ